MKTLIISVGGSLVAPVGGVDRAFLRLLRAETLKLVQHGYRVVLITGGGKVCRLYQQAASSLARVSDDDLDWIGIASTKLNAELVRTLFGRLAYDRVIGNPSDPIRTSKKILVGAGYEPGASSDIDAVLLAKNLGAKTVVNLSNIEYVYDKDPRKSKDAKPLKQVTWDELLKITGTRWIPGLNAPFDPTAAKLARSLRLTVMFMHGKHIRKLSKYVLGESFPGTVIS